MSKATCPECAKDGKQEPTRVRGLCLKHYQRARHAGNLDKTPPPDACPACVGEHRARPRKIRYVGLCEPHYKQGVKAGTVTPVHAPRKGLTICAVVDCDRKPIAKSMCTKHYAASRRGVSFELRDVPVSDKYGATCSFDGCETHVSGHGLCAAHLSQKRRGIELRPVRHQLPVSGTCEAPDCPRSARHAGLCETHYNRKLRDEENWARPIKKTAPKGSGSISHGYRIVQQNGRSRGEHRVIMERLLKRPLYRYENVHHRNGNRSDNRTNGPLVLGVSGKLYSGNLELWSTNQPSGQEIGPKLQWATEMLANYGQFAGWWAADLNVLRRVLAVHGDEAEQKRYAPLAAEADRAA